MRIGVWFGWDYRETGRKKGDHSSIFFSCETGYMFFFWIQTLIGPIFHANVSFLSAKQFSNSFSVNTSSKQLWKWQNLEPKIHLINYHPLPTSTIHQIKVMAFLVRCWNSKQKIWMKRASENKGTHTVSSKKASFAEQKYDLKKILRFKRKKKCLYPPL